MMHNTETTTGTADTTMGPLSIDGAQPVWMTLNDARERGFTGELVFEGDPDVLAYLDHGVVYYAEESGGITLGQRLLQAGLLDAEQLERGTVRVGDIEHLGRLFDREPSIDRDTVLVMTETFTDDLVMRLANETVTTVRVTAYRHHPSGLHRWFVAPLDAATSVRPVAALHPLDAAVVGDLPGTSVDDLVEELTIEWDEPFDGADDLEVLAPVEPDDLVIEEAPAVDDAVAEDEVALSLDMADFVDLDTGDDVDADADDLLTGDEVDVVADRLDDELSLAAEVDVEETFDVIWPNGVVEQASEAASSTTEESALDAAELPVDDDEPHVEQDELHVEQDELHVEHDVVVIEDEELTAHDAATDEIRFEIPELEVAADDDVATDHVDDDVADAVRRALAAIEGASAPSVPAAEQPVPDVVAHEALPSAAAPAVSEMPDAPISGGLSAFAPPTLDTSAEAIYARAAAGDTETGQPQLPGAGKASVVFVDEESGGGDERSSALRRLIRSLGRKDR